MFVQFDDMFRDKRWRARRLFRLATADYKCERCGNRGTSIEPLRVHHKFYKDDALPWEYYDDELEVLCKRCHDAHHKALPHLGIWRWTRPSSAHRKPRRPHDPQQFRLFPDNGPQNRHSDR